MIIFILYKDGSTRSVALLAFVPHLASAPRNNAHKRSVTVAHEHHTGIWHGLRALW